MAPRGGSSQSPVDAGTAGNDRLGQQLEKIQKGLEYISSACVDATASGSSISDLHLHGQLHFVRNECFQLLGPAANEQRQICGLLGSIGSRFSRLFRIRRDSNLQMFRKQRAQLKAMLSSRLSIVLADHAALHSSVT